MTQTASDPDPRTVLAPEAEAEAKLARLGVQIEAMQGLLVRLLQDVVRAESRLDQSRATQLADVNEQLVVAALTSQADAEAAGHALQAATQSALHDALTGLPNRAMLRDHFAQAQAKARRHGARFALLFLDLDRFKPLNDAHGHAFGDQVLRQVADRLSAAVREVDTVSRHGGDEFVVLLSELGQAGDAMRVADKLQAAIAEPMVVDGHAVVVTASVGIAHCPDDGDDLDTLATQADAAMYAAKRRQASGDDAGTEAASPAQAAASGAPAPPPTGPGPADAPLESQLADLREANERLVLSALDAQALQAAAELARQRQQAFMAAVAEELSNPLAPIRIATAMLGRAQTDEPLLPRLQQLVNRQIAQVARLVDAVSIEGGGLRLARAPVDFATVVDQAIVQQRPAMAARMQGFTQHRPPGPWPMLGDADQLGLIVANLLDNASRYTPEGGSIDLDIALDIPTDAAGPRLTLTLTDTGIGISPALLPLVFEPFVQDPRALFYNPGGLGIGLTVARALARAHGGQITAGSAPSSRGSRFVLTLPLAPAEPAKPAETRA